MGQTRRRNRWKILAGGVALLVASVAASGCMPIVEMFNRQPPTPAPTAVATATPTPTPSPTLPAPTSSPTPRPAVSQEEAQATVRAWFDALAAQDYQKMQELTAERGMDIALGVSGSIQREAAAQQVRITLGVQRLDLDPAPLATRGQAVRADFAVDARAMVGPLAVPVRQLNGAATFLVDRVNGEPRIVDIYDATGLPTQ